MTNNLTNSAGQLLPRWQSQGVSHVFFPYNSTEVEQLVAEARQNGHNIVPVGRGTKVGKYLTDECPNTVFISLDKMNKILDISPNNLTITVEAGVSLNELQKKLAEFNLWLPVKYVEQEERTLGGLVAENPDSYLKYAYRNIGDYILGLEFVNSDGKLIRAGGKTVKNVSGYDFSRLLNGSLGTLGIITAITFKLQPCPVEERILLLSLSCITQAATCLEEAIKMDTPLVACHLSTYFRRYGSPDRVYPRAVMALSLEGSKPVVEDYTGKLQAVAKSQGIEVRQTQADQYWQDHVREWGQISSKKQLAGSFNKKNLSSVLSKLANMAPEGLAGMFVDLGAGNLNFFFEEEQLSDATVQELLQGARDLITLDLGECNPHPLFIMLKKSMDNSNCFFKNNRFLHLP